MEHIIQITLHAKGFPPIPCKQIHFLGTRAEAFAYGRDEGKRKGAELGASRATVEVLS